MLKRKTTVWQVMLLGILLMLSSCYHRHNSHQQHAAMVEYSDRQLDSISFSTTHHYTNKYNFLVFKDSLELMRQQPEEYISGLKVDTFAVKKNHLLVVTDIRMVPQDSIDSVWVQLATENNDFGWVRESKLLRRVVPDDPISEFIMTFSNVHLLIFLVVIVVEPEMWRHFYFHPSLNPFAVPHLLGVFLALVWAVLIVALACVDEVYHRLTFGEGLLYLGGLAGVCALDYIIFSVLSLYYIGYVLLIAYIYFAIKTYRRK